MLSLHQVTVTADLTETLHCEATRPVVFSVGVVASWRPLGEVRWAAVKEDEKNPPDILRFYILPGRLVSD